MSVHDRRDCFGAKSVIPCVEIATKPFREPARSGQRPPYESIDVVEVNDQWLVVTNT